MTTILSPQNVPSLPIFPHINDPARQESYGASHSESSGELLTMPPRDSYPSDMPAPARRRTSIESSGASNGRASSTVVFADEPANGSHYSSRPSSQLQRANTDSNMRRRQTNASNEAVEEDWEMRHGWEDQYTSNEYLGLLSSVSWICLVDETGLTCVRLGFLHVLHRQTP